MSRQVSALVVNEDVNLLQDLVAISRVSGGGDAVCALCQEAKAALSLKGLPRHNNLCGNQFC